MPTQQQQTGARHAAMELTLHRLTNHAPGAIYEEVVRLCTGAGSADLIEVAIHLADAMAAVLIKDTGSREDAIKALQQQLANTHVHHNPAGWTLAFLSPDPQSCTTNHTPDGAPCADTAVWKVVEHHDHDNGPGLTLSFWCDTHLPDEHRPAA